MIELKSRWWVDYLGKPWVAKPKPPESYNCGELVRSIHRDLFGIETANITCSNAQSRLQAAKAMQPDVFDLIPVEGREPRTLDVVFMGRKKQILHCGIIIIIDGEIKVLHCPESAVGVCLDSLLELRYSGFTNFKYFHHKDMGKTLYGEN